MDIDEILLDSEDRMIKCVADYESHLKGVRSGQASVEMVDHVHVDIPAYGGVVPLKSVALTSKADARMLVIKPFDPKTIKEIEKGINAANLGLTPMNDGKIIRLPIPPLTEERRKDLVKKLHGVAENHRVAVRNIRRDGNEAVKKLLKDKKITEDDEKRALDEIQKMTDAHMQRIDQAAKSKEKEILEIR